jgi:hypothetical protein
MSYRKPLIAAALALAGALAAGAANAGSDVHWSIGVNLPVYPNVSVGVSSAPPVYGPRYGYGYGYQVPVVVAPPPVVYMPQPVYRRPVPVYSAPVYVQHHPRGNWNKHDRWDRRDDRRHDRHDHDHDHDRHGR